ncbi:MAG: hypothetical protein MJY42_00970 [Bacteroidales bacterium]|nr:hypothetical protein [Bacteroidales bacterium]
MKKTILKISCLAAVAAIVFSCSTRAKVAKIEKAEEKATLELSEDLDTSMPDLTVSVSKRDTIEVQDFDGKKVTLMKATKDKETGDMVATDVIDAAIVTARFRHLAERQGKVDISFQIVVPQRMQDSKWQLRFYPDMFVLGDSIRLEPVYITGKDYRKAQLRGYQQYDKFLNKIISDSTKFVDIRMLEIFLQRNIPQIYAFKEDTNYVSDEKFLSFYGVSEQEAVEHYTNNTAKKMNEKRKSKMQKMYDKYVRVPIVTEGIRLDTVIMDANGDFIYNYIQTINTRPKMKRVDVVLSGEIFERDQHIYDIPKCPPLTFYISTLSTFAIDLDKYLTKVIERRVSANTESHIDFQLGRSEVLPTLGDNQEEIDLIKETLAMLLENNIFDLDSITVAATASPEGSLALNRRLAQSRSESVSSYFSKYIKHYRDSLDRYGGFTVSADNSVQVEDKHLGRIEFTPRCIPENWEDLGRCIMDDDTLTSEQKDRYFELMQVNDADAREHQMQKESWYKYVKDKYYPGLRTVKFRFFLHRKGMVKDTVHTTVLDSVYIKGVECLKNMDYEEALEYLRPYNDFNTAVAYTALNRNKSAMMILSPMDRTAEVNYLLAILYARMGEEGKAVECYLKAIRQKDIYIHRGNLDPEISHLIKAYGLGKYIDEMLSVDINF